MREDSHESERFVGGTLLGLKEEERAMSQGGQPVETGKSKGTVFARSFFGEHSPVDIFILAH